MAISTIAGLTLYFEGYNRVLKRHYPSIYEFVHEHGAKKCRVAFGPQIGDFVVFNAETGRAKWKHTGLSESRVLKGKKRVKHCSLGQNDSCVVLWADGGVDWAVDYNYPELDKILKKTDQGDVVVCQKGDHLLKQV